MLMKARHAEGGGGGRLNLTSGREKMVAPPANPWAISGPAVASALQAAALPPD